MVKQIIQKEQGLTLIEVIATVALLTIIGALSFPFLNRAFFDFQDGMEKSKLFKELQMIESQIIHVVRNTAPGPNGETFLQIDEGNPNIYYFFSAEDGTDRYSFEWKDGRLIYKKGDSYFELSKHVTAFSLREEGDLNKRLVYTIELSSNVNGENINVGFTDRFMFFSNWE